MGQNLKPLFGMEDITAPIEGGAGKRDVRLLPLWGVDPDQAVRETATKNVDTITPKIRVQKHLAGKNILELDVQAINADGVEYWDALKVDLYKLKGQIIYILVNNEGARNSDDVLERELLTVFYGVTDNTPFRKYRSMEDRPSRDNIKRLRARLNQKGYLLPTNPDVLEKRRKLEGNFRSFFGKDEDN